METFAYVPPGGGYPTRVSTGPESERPRSSGGEQGAGSLGEAMQAASAMATDAKRRFVDACNTIGSQTSISVSNYTGVSYALTLEVGGIVYQRETLPANDALVAQEDDVGAPLTGRSGSAKDFVGANFAVVKFKCGYVFYSISATPIVDDGLSHSPVQGSRTIHFVYGGSKVSLRSDLRDPRGFRLVNETTEIGGNEMSDDLELTLEVTRESARHVKDTYLDPAIAKVRTTLQSSMSGRNMGNSTNGATGSSAFGSQIYDDYGVQSPSQARRQEQMQKKRQEETAAAATTSKQQAEEPEPNLFGFEEIDEDPRDRYYAPVSSSASDDV
ncbi:Hypothetical Protein FCC1311_026442 [Hondaea fermentalgiana]|uniref:Uncharacterized protein n=1 Tax=Hondaea fermentalgiana TaxID=2315210 RepID=A0A2R5GCV2_9STRA|nr:Hypothetical Protein FCC1311_026442 [Hondaea fermentalgiana]|eukprot:GBG26423.1 Hypothetical Protein FCC1311_026442 [Hondaea fermentalgiana]